MRAAERKMNDVLSKINESFLVFYSVAWQARTLSGNVRDGEADFVVVHPELGILATYLVRQVSRASKLCR